MEDDIRLYPSSNSTYVDNNGRVSTYLNGEWVAGSKELGSMVFDSYYDLAVGSVVSINDETYKVVHSTLTCRLCPLLSTGSDYCNLTHCKADNRLDGKGVILVPIEE